jgi:signal transduction histidine kinase
VLDLTQSDTGSLLLAEEQVDLEVLCREAGEVFSRTAEAKGVEFALDVDPSLGTVTGDRRRLRQSVDNVLANALSQSREGGRVLLHGIGNNRDARITISDNGAGIAPADQAHVFDRFYRTMVGREGRDEALGLGLPLAKQFIEAHGGAIELQSEIGVGTTMQIRLPRNA